MKVSFAVLLACLVSANAEYTGERRSLAGTPVPRSYIAKAIGADCNQILEQIELKKLSIEGSEQKQRDGPSRAMRISSCYFSFKGSEALAAEVGKISGVQYVEKNRFVETLQQGPPQSWGLDRVDQAQLPLDNAAFKGSPDGTGVKIYVIDTGIVATHNEFQNGAVSRASYGADFVNEGSQADKNGHGTHCSGTAAGKNFGIARGASVIGVKVLSGSGSGTFEGVIGGIEWAANDSPNVPSVLSMSLGGGKSQAVDDAVIEAAAKGNIVVVAAGNDNANACNYSPAAAGGNGMNTGVVTVGSTTSSDGRSSFSNYGTCVDIFAPGSSIKSSWIGGNSATNTISGTSMATPHVAGVAAVLLQKNAMNRDDALRDLLVNLPVTGVISGSLSGAPNKLLQVSTAAAPTQPPVTLPPAAAPVTRPPVPSPTPPPTRSWTCPNSWFGTDDGCDCECGGGDPDCDTSFSRLYCNGRPARSNEYCDFGSDTCIVLNGLDISQTGRTTETFAGKAAPASAAEEESSLPLVPIFGAVAGCAALVAVGAIVYARRRTNEAATAPANSVVVKEDML